MSYRNGTYAASDYSVNAANSSLNELAISHSFSKYSVRSIGNNVLNGTYSL